MDFKTLEHFIKKKMKMTHIYQPLMIRTLLSSDNTATVEDIARAFVNSDPSQLEYYKQIAKRWPHITLRKHNVIKYDKGVYTLLAENITSPRQKQMSDPTMAAAIAINSCPRVSLELSAWYTLRC